MNNMSGQNTEFYAVVLCDNHCLCKTIYRCHKMPQNGCQVLPLWHMVLRLATNWLRLAAYRMSYIGCTFLVPQNATKRLPNVAKFKNVHFCPFRFLNKMEKNIVTSLTIIFQDADANFSLWCGGSFFLANYKDLFQVFKN